MSEKKIEAALSCLGETVTKLTFISDAINPRVTGSNMYQDTFTLKAIFLFLDRIIVELNDTCNALEKDLEKEY